MTTLTSLGIGSGLNSEEIVTQLVALERQPIDRLKTQASTLDAQLSSFGKVQSAIDALRSAARTLTDASTWKAATASSADSTAVTATASSGTSPGSYAVKVTSLAAAQMNASSPLANSAATVGQGTLHISLGRWADDLSSFTDKSTIDITIGPGEDTLDKVRDKINNTSGINVRASIVNDANGSRLVLQSRTTGAENGFRIQVDDTDGTGDDNSGLSRLAYDPENAAAVSSRTQAGVNAAATINGLAVESATNTLSDVIDGVSLTLGKVTTGTVDITVSRDSASMRKSIDTFVSSYNDMVKLLREQTKYDATNKTAGTLQGDRTAISLLNQLRSAMSSTSTASGTFSRLSDIGMQLQADGTIKTTSSKVDAAIAKADELQKFFATESTTPGARGLAFGVRQLADSLLGTEGPLSTRQEGLRRLKTANSDRQASMEDRVAQTEKRLRAQYQALDTSMAKLTSLQSYVTQQVSSWNS